jgi:hypothetical protein
VSNKEVYVGVLMTDAFGQLFGDGDGAVPSSGAADAEGEVGLAFCGVAGDEEGE